MQIKVCFVYPWATFGGVERVLINRLIAFKHSATAVVADIMFLHDSGGLAALKQALLIEGINADIICAPDFPAEKDYDLVCCIDCPQAFSLCERRQFRFIVECHTSYSDNRRYLQTIPVACRTIATPSRLFSQRIHHELKANRNIDILELSNFVPWEYSQPEITSNLPKWSRTPILFLGRLDKLKDPIALLDALDHIEHKYPCRFMGIFCGPASPEINMQEEIQKRGASSRVVLLPPVPFSSTKMLFDMLRKSGGIFVSPSTGESFGLSSAEAISAGLPVVLSNIKEHLYLIEGHEEKFSYELGDNQKLAEKILNVFDQYKLSCKISLQLRERFSSKKFLDDWNNLLLKLNLL